MGGNSVKKRKGGFDSFTMDDYTITKDGRVINNKWGREVKPDKNGKGYLRVHIVGKKRFIHRMVAEKYIPNPENKPQVNHIDGNKTNNNVENLEWVSNYENRKHAIAHGLNNHGEKCGTAKLTLEEAKFIKYHPDIPAKKLAEKYNVCPRAIRNIRNGRTWKEIG